MKNIMYLCSTKQMASMRKIRLVFLALFLLPEWLSAQEMIRGAVDYYLSDSSIVRQYKKDVTLIYNRSDNPRNENISFTSTFMLVSEDSSNVPIFYMQPLYVNDFEILKAHAYFCGYMRDGNQKKGIIGYFNINQFPNCNVYYFIIDTCKEMIKMDVYQPDGELHPDVNVVATGTTGTRTDVLVEMNLVSYPPNNFHIYISDRKSEFIDDVAAIKNYVVVSTRDEESGIPVINFWQFIRPTLPGMSIFNYGVNRKSVSSPFASTPVYLEHTVGDQYSAVYRDYGYFRMTILKTDVSPMNNFVSVDVLGLENGVIPRDIKWNSKTNVYDVLGLYVPDYYYWVKIYHFPQTVFDGTAPYGTGTKYLYKQLWSIDPCLYPSPYFMASGEEGEIPRLFRYSSGQSGDCSEMFNYQYEKGEPVWKFSDGSIPFAFTDNLPLNMLEPEWRIIPFPWICGEK